MRASPRARVQSSRGGALGVAARTPDPAVRAHQHHFLLRAVARSISLREVFALSNETSFEPSARCVGTGRVYGRLLLRRRRQTQVCAQPPAVTLPRLRAHLLADLGDAVRPPQGAAAGLPRGHRDGQQCGRRAVGPAVRPGLELAAQQCFRAHAHAAREHDGRPRRAAAVGGDAFSRERCPGRAPG
jgi:hypothetical protein